MGELGLTPSQTVGPFLHLALADPAARYAVRDVDPAKIIVRGRVVDGNDDPVPDAVVETWQIDGRFGRSATDGEGRWEIHTVKPPPAATRDGRAQAPHLLVSVFARGLLDRVVTRCYFADEDVANSADPILRVVPADRHHRLLATVDSVHEYRLDICLQGADESVFFAI